MLFVPQSSFLVLFDRLYVPGIVPIPFSKFANVLFVIHSSALSRHTFSNDKKRIIELELSEFLPVNIPDLRHWEYS